MPKRIGFACKWIDDASQVNGIKPTDPAKIYNTGSTTVAWLNRQTREVAEQKLWDLMVQNISSIERLVERVGELDENLRMVRLSSDILPVYTESTWCGYWRRPDVRLYAERAFARVGTVARERDVRLSFHPGQFTVLASDNDNIVNRSIEEFEYHADMIRWMGYGQRFQDFKCNVHIAGRRGAQGIRDVYGRLSPEARNTLTIENEEMKHGLVDCLELYDLVPIVLDIHHHWVREGEYIRRDDPRVAKVIESWRGVRPTCHYSVSREDLLLGHDTNTLPDMKVLLESGYKKSKLRAHSDFYWNTAVNDWALTFLESFDMMCESKAKNLASFALYNRAVEKGLVGN
jgi:UV DNA damage repair endonuclease